MKALKLSPCKSFGCCLKVFLGDRVKKFKLLLKVDWDDLVKAQSCF